MYNLSKWSFLSAANHYGVHMLPKNYRFVSVSSCARLAGVVDDIHVSANGTIAPSNKLPNHQDRASFSMLCTSKANGKMSSTRKSPRSTGFTLFRTTSQSSAISCTSKHTWTYVSVFSNPLCLVVHLRVQWQCVEAFVSFPLAIACGGLFGRRAL